ncbi:MAG: hypothetical protein AB7T06_01490 [Kofleriaceae bacterium]
MTMLATAIVTLSAIVALEVFVRSRGFQPSVKDDEYLWATERARASDRSPTTMAILGSSRILLAFNPGAFRETLPRWKYVQLAVQGSRPLGALMDLALDPAFRGVALVDIVELNFKPSGYGAMDRELAAYHRGWRAAGELAERWLSTEVQERFALLAAGGLRTLRHLSFKGAWPTPPYTTTAADRTRYADYSLVDARARRKHQLARIESWDDVQFLGGWLAEPLALEIFVAMIQSRGGNVVFVRMPTCDERWAYDESVAPKAEYWDRFAAITRAQTIHFADYPQLSSFECPDTSHIDSKDGPRFTRALLDILVERNVLQP